MAIRTEQLLAQLTPAIKLDFGGSSSMERERLKLAREQFEASLRQHEEEKEQRRIEEQGRQARAALQAEQERQQAEATKAAALLAQKQAAMSKTAEHAGNMNPEAVDAMIPYLGSLGQPVDVLGQVGGMPTYQFRDIAAEQEEAARTQQQAAAGDPMAGLGYPSNERGSLDTERRPMSTEDAFGQALAASQHARDTGQPLRAPDEEDYQGAVPRNVIDMGAMKAQMLARLKPGLQAQVDTYADPELRAQAERAMEGTLASGLTEREGLAQFDKAMDDPVSLYKDRVAAEKAAAPKGLNDMDRSTLRGRGESAASEAANKEYKLPDAMEARRQGQLVLEMLDSGDSRVHQFLGPAVMSVSGVVGAQSNLDLAETLGATRQTYLDQGVDWFRQRFMEGGFSPEQVKALRVYLDAGVNQATMQAFDFMDAARVRIRNGDESEDERTGWRNYLMRLPPDVREEYELYRHDQGDEEAEGDVLGRQPTAGRDAPAGSGEVEDELMAQAAEAGLDPEQILPLMRTESGGDPTVRNKAGSSASGLFQFTDDTAKGYGLKNAAEYAALPPAEQIRLGLQRFKDIGLDEDSTADDYAMANAAPGYVGRADDTPIKEYASGTDFGDDVRAKNPGWVPKGGGEITVGSIKAFYRRHRGAEPEAETEADEPEPPRTKVEQGILDILR